MSAEQVCNFPHHAKKSKGAKQRRKRVEERSDRLQCTTYSLREEGEGRKEKKRIKR
jgi:hypothetical protein